MKTKTFLAAISLALIIVGASAWFTGTNAKDNNNRAAVSDKEKVSYLVTISHPSFNEQMLNGYYLIVTNNKGQRVAPAVTVTPGVWSYLIRENGPVFGSRTFKLVKAPHTTGPLIHYKDVTLNGPFSCGYTYDVVMIYYEDFIPVESATAIR